MPPGELEKLLRGEPAAGRLVELGGNAPRRAEPGAAARARAAATRGGAAGAILGTSGQAFRPTAEAASRNFNAQPGIKRTSLDLSDAPRVG